MTQPLRIGLAGLGTVGQSVVRLLDRHGARMAERAGREIEIVAVSARDRMRDRGINLDAVRWYDDPTQLAADEDIDLFVELIGGDEGPARASVETALGVGKSVVTANKALLAKHGQTLAELAEHHGADMRFEAAIAGGIPIVKTLREALAGNGITRVTGILNGTCNYILSRMEDEGLAFDDCLRDAQALGYAEADPTFDIEGFDAAHKLALLSSLAFGTRVSGETVYVEGITAIRPVDFRMAADFGYRIKLLGVAQMIEGRLEQRVHPALVPEDRAIGGIDGVTNAVEIEADFVGDLLLTGPGAGGDATASAVVGDIADLAEGQLEGGSPVFGMPTATMRAAEAAPMANHAARYYLRLQAADRIGAAAGIATRMAERGISLESIVQRHDLRSQDHGASVPVVLVTHGTTEAAVTAALRDIDGDGHLVERPQMIRIET